MTAKTYEITSITDLLKVPSDRRSACLEEILFGLETIDFVNGDVEVMKPLSFTWTDDGEMKQTIYSDEQGDLLTFTVEKP